ncbi:MAG: hypothetical protein II491_03025, partial [Prevotella sp.]|nr:hypothetical protein [Prevotella sp.]
KSTFAAPPTAHHTTRKSHFCYIPQPKSPPDWQATEFLSVRNHAVLPPPSARQASSSALGLQNYRFT